MTRGAFWRALTARRFWDRRCEECADVITHGAYCRPCYHAPFFLHQDAWSTDLAAPFGRGGRP